MKTEFKIGDEVKIIHPTVHIEGMMPFWKNAKGIIVAVNQTQHTVLVKTAFGYAAIAFWGILPVSENANNSTECDFGPGEYDGEW